MRRVAPALALSLLSVGAALHAGCGSSGREPRAPERKAEPARARGRDGERERSARKAGPRGLASERFHVAPGPRGMAVEGLIGGLDPAGVDRTFGTTYGALEDCWRRGTRRIAFLGGRIEFLLRVGRGGRVIHTHAAESTLGDRETETCMLDVLRAAMWPPPVGGSVGVARAAIQFDPPSGARAPARWRSRRVAGVLSDNAAEIAACRAGAAGEFRATVYVHTVTIEPPAVDAGADAGDGGAGEAGPREVGRAMAVGLTPPDEDGDRAVDCLVRVLENATYPVTAGWPAKVSFSL